MEQAELVKIVLKHKNKVSLDNGYYWWDLSTPKIDEARALLVEFTEDVLADRLTEDQYLTALYMYFDTVYDESERAWKQYIKDILIRERPKVLPIHDTPYPKRELIYLAQQHDIWFGFSCVEFDNDMEFDYSYIEPHDPTIRSADHVMHFGKYTPLGTMKRYYTIRELFQVDPQYLDWASRKVESFKLSDELKEELAQWVESAQRKKERY